MIERNPFISDTKITMTIGELESILKISTIGIGVEMLRDVFNCMADFERSAYNDFADMLQLFIEKKGYSLQEALWTLDMLPLAHDLRGTTIKMILYVWEDYIHHTLRKSLARWGHGENIALACDEFQEPVSGKGVNDT